MDTWTKRISEPGILLADGAMGTMLFEAGLQFGDPPDGWNVDQPERIRRVHRAYLEAGSRIVLTNTFGSNRFRLALHRLEARVGDFNRAGAALAQAAVKASGRQALVAGDIGPTGSILEPVGELSFDEAVDGFAEQAAALIEGGVDLVWIETMADLEEVRAAIEGVRRASATIPVAATMTFDTRGYTMMGVSPEKAVAAISGWGAAAVGGNCGNGPEEVIDVMTKMHGAAPSALLIAKANAGIPTIVDGRAVYRATPAAMAEYAGSAADAGARIVGACCGSTPDHIRAMADALVGRLADG
jgi:5-methyltetrahydrofolate--homocysteine methyltransferase